MPQALASAFEGVFAIMGIPTPALRPIAVAIDKLMELLVAYKQILLGLEVDTRAMTVSDRHCSYGLNHQNIEMKSYLSYG